MKCVQGNNMTTASIVQRIWNYCNTLRDDGVSDMENLPEPDTLAKDIIEGLEVSINSFKNVYKILNKK